MWEPPANVQETTAQIIAAGIAQRMLTGSHQSHLPNSTHGCSFWVEAIDADPIDDEERVQVIVQYPPEGYLQGFAAMPDESFGVFNQAPLNPEQQRLVDRLAATRKVEKANRT